MPVMPVLGKQKQMDSLGSVAGQPCLLGEHQASDFVSRGDKVDAT